MGLNIAYRDTGSGPGVVLAHCSSGSHREWDALGTLLQQEYRVIAPDLSGYGQSERWPENETFNPFIDVELLEALCDMADEAVHLVGHSYGGAMALEVARRHPHYVKSLSLIEPVCFHLLQPGRREQAWQQVHRVATAIIAAVQAGDQKRAADIFMGFWFGRLRWWFMPKKIKHTIIDSMDKVAHEFAVLDQLPMQLDDYKKITLPVLLIKGSRSQRPAAAIVEVLDELLPAAESVNIAGASHMSPLTHAGQVNELVYRFISGH